MAKNKPNRPLNQSFQQGCAGQYTTFENISTGILLSYTEVFNLPEGFGREPYLLGLVSLDDGVNIVAQLADFPASKLKPGQRVKMVIRKILENGEAGPIVYGYKFQAE